MEVLRDVSVNLMITYAWPCVYVCVRVHLHMHVHMSVCAHMLYVRFRENASSTGISHYQAL